MPDGFFKGELYGKTGLVPSNFVQLILDQEGSLGETNEEVSGSGSYPQKFVALYDYDPMTQSPNDNPETELAFCEGDIIDVTGPMDEVRSFEVLKICKRSLKDLIVICSGISLCLEVIFSDTPPIS